MLDFNQLRIFLEIAQKSGYHIGSKPVRNHQVLLLSRDLPGIQRENTGYDLMMEIAQHGLCGTKTIYVSPHQPKRIKPLSTRLEKAKLNVERRIRNNQVIKLQEMIPNGH